jgi:hypothetical protein
MSADGAAFLAATPEAAEHNQYWYSAASVKSLTDAALELAARAGPAARIAFVSTPSLFFAVPAGARRAHALLDIDAQWASAEGFSRFDFRAGAGALAPELVGAFDVVVIDPPFITADVWRAYADAARALLRAGGAAILTTVAENGALLADLFPGARRAPFQPSIPRLVYQYDAFCTAEPLPAALAVPNPEVP